MQAYERQLDAVNRAMQRGEEAAGGLDRERQAMLEQLRASEQAGLKRDGCFVAAIRQDTHMRSSGPHAPVPPCVLCRCASS